MESLSVLTTGAIIGWLMIAALIVIAIVLYIYHRGSEIDHEMERKYSMLGAIGGKAEKDNDEDDLMDYEKLEEKEYPNDNKN